MPRRRLPLYLSTLPVPLLLKGLEGNPPLVCVHYLLFTPELFLVGWVGNLELAAEGVWVLVVVRVPGAARDGIGAQGWRCSPRQLCG